MDGGEFFEPESMYTIMAGSFPIWYFLSVPLSKSKGIFAFGPSSSPYNSLFMLFIESVFSYDLFVPIFCSQIVLSPCHLNVGMSLHLFPYLQVKFSFVILEFLFCLYCLILYWDILNLPSFASTFWFISSRCIICSSCVALLFSSQHILAFFCLLKFLSVVETFLSVFPVWFPIQVLNVC